MKRLYLKIYFAIIASLLLVVLLAAGVWRLGAANPPMAYAFEMAGEFAGAALPPADAPRAAQEQAIERLAQRLNIDLALFDPMRRPIAMIGRPLPPPPPHAEDGGWLRGPGGPAWSFHLPDGRWIVAQAPMRHRNPIVGFVLFLGGIALAVAAAAYPIARGMTRRLERLQTGVETLGAGNLAARVKVEGRDEVAQLAASFNRAAARIEELVGAHRLLLANASHELRTPLSRIRLAELARDIAELDLLIDEILLTSRLDAVRTLEHAESVDLLGLVAEECAHYENCTAGGDPVSVNGDPRLLRRLIRNLIDNAQRHGAPPVTVEVRQLGDRAVIDVMDRGPGIPDADRQHVFEPFHRLASEAGQREATGAGLGLSLVRQIARLHGGDAKIAPRPDCPSTVRVELPA
jgi:signal transduction histidine kinase